MKAAELVEVEHQQTSYPGRDGVEDVRFGERGAFTTVTGMLVGSTDDALGAAIATFRGTARWGKCVLVDQFGNGWPFVRLHTFKLTGRVVRDPGYGCVQDYEARF